MRKTVRIQKKNDKKARILRKNQKKTNEIKKINNICLKNDEIHCRISIQWKNILKNNSYQNSSSEFRRENERRTDWTRVIPEKDSFISGNVNANRRKDKNMGNIGAAARYLIRLYFKTEPKYQCSRTKIEKLLSIANYVSIRQQSQMFSETMCVNQCGTGFPEVAWLFREDIMEGINDDSGVILNSNFIDENAYYPDVYESDYPLGDKEDLLKMVFLSFGACSAKYLGIEINGFVKEISKDTEDFPRPIIDYEKAARFFGNDELLEKYSENKIISFILNISPIST
jgi:hypothetical protein